MGRVSHLHLMDLGDLQLQSWGNEAIAIAQTKHAALFPNRRSGVQKIRTPV